MEKPDLRKAARWYVRFSGEAFSEADAAEFIHSVHAQGDATNILDSYEMVLGFGDGIKEIERWPLEEG